MRATLIAALASLACGTALAQQANVNLDYNPQKNTGNLVPFSAPLNSPDVRDDRTVTFRLKAPEARTVALAGVALLVALGQEKPVPFQKGTDGVWSLTVGPLRPDMYVYHLVVDGVAMADPSNTVAGFTAMPPYSQLVVHGDAPAYYDARDVPHGTVTRHVYRSGVTSGERELYVYTPPGYDRAKAYPVLYLVGGSGDLPHNWVYDGRVGFIMDNLLAEGKVVPMVIAIPNNQVLHRSHPRHVELTFPMFEAEMRRHVIPLVERQYGVRTDPEGRALAGLSMGGRHTMFVGFRSLDLFASFGVLSAGDVDSETSIAGFLNDPDANRKVRYLFVGQGTEEARGRLGQRCVALHEALLRHGVEHEYYVGGHGGHDWATWRHLVHERFLPGLWRGQAQAAPPPVKVEGGLVQGVAGDGLTVYKGVPFAAPPVGGLRWRAPRPAAPWTGVRNADQYAPGCLPSMGDPPPSGASEDCLYLNVWTPAKAAGDRLPVLVWIYGGGFNGGATSVPVHDGARLARRGVVLVSIAYRVGVLGFLAHPDLSAESAHRVSGNYGLLDLVAGLGWIQRNIAAFGGDPGRVTIFGESAGGIAVSMLGASPLAKGLFHGAISQSGGSFGPVSRSPSPGENMRPLADAEASGAEMAKAAGAPSLPELRALPAEKVIEAGRRQRGMAWPIVDGWVIPDDQYRLYEAGRFNDTPILVGYNSDEGLSFTRVRTPEEYVAGVRARYGPFADRLLDAYPVASDRIPKTARDLARDSAFGWHTWSWARLQSSRGRGKAYLYYFDQHPERAPGSPEADHGAPHGVDVPYVFETLDDSGRPVTDADRRISDAMAAYWTNFAKRLDPNGSGLPEWPAFSGNRPAVMVFAGAPSVGPVPSEGALRVLDGYFAWRRSPEGSATAAPPAEGRNLAGQPRPSGDEPGSFEERRR